MYDEESTMRLVNLEETIIVSNMAFGKGTLFYTGHDCDNADHAHLKTGGIDIVLTLTVVDAHGKQHTLVIPKDSDVVKSLCDMDTYYHIKKILEVDN